MSFLLSTIGTGLINGGLNQLFSNMSSKRQFDYWQQMQNSMNEFNSPVNQVKRFRQAGLHPGLMYSGHGGSSLQASVSPPSGGNFPGVSVDPLALTRIQNETKVADAEANYKNALAEGQTKENLTYEERFGKEMALLISQAKLNSANTNLASAQKVTQDFLNLINSATKIEQIGLIQQEFKKLIAEVSLTQEQKKYWANQTILAETENKLRNMQTMHEVFKIGLTKAEIDYTMASIRLVDANVDLTKAQTVQVRVDTMDGVVDLWVDARSASNIIKYNKWRAENMYQQSELTENQRINVRAQNRVFYEKHGADMVESYAGAISDVMIGTGMLWSGAGSIAKGLNGVR